MASDVRLKEQLPRLTDRIVSTYKTAGSIHYLGHCPLPNYDEIVGCLEDLKEITFKDLSKVEIVGIYPNYKSAYDAWKQKAQQTVDNAEMRYFVVHLHRLLDPATDPAQR